MRTRPRPRRRLGFLAVGLVVAVVAPAEVAAAQTSGANSSSGDVSWVQAVLALVAFAGVGWFSLRIWRNSMAAARRNRNERIRAQNAATEHAHDAVTSTRVAYDAMLAEAAGEAERIIEAGRAQAAAAASDVTQDGRARLDAIRAESNAELDALRNSAVAGVGDEAARLAAEVAQTIVGPDADEPATRSAVERIKRDRERGQG